VLTRLKRTVGPYTIQYQEIVWNDLGTDELYRLVWKDWHGGFVFANCGDAIIQAQGLVELRWCNAHTRVVDNNRVSVWSTDLLK